MCTSLAQTGGLSDYCSVTGAWTIKLPLRTQNVCPGYRVDVAVRCVGWLMTVQGLLVNWPCILDGGRNKFDSYCDFFKQHSLSEVRALQIAFWSYWTTCQIYCCFMSIFPPSQSQKFLGRVRLMSRVLIQPINCVDGSTVPEYPRGEGFTAPTKIICPTSGMIPAIMTTA